jgi:hypothetical protein
MTYNETPTEVLPAKAGGNRYESNLQPHEVEAVKKGRLAVQDIKTRIRDLAEVCVVLNRQRNQVVIAELLGVSEPTVSKLLKWADAGYPPEGPYVFANQPKAIEHQPEEVSSGNFSDDADQEDDQDEDEEVSSGNFSDDDQEEVDRAHEAYRKAYDHDAEVSGPIKPDAIRRAGLKCVQCGFAKATTSIFTNGLKGFASKRPRRNRPWLKLLPATLSPPE